MNRWILLLAALAAWASSAQANKGGKKIVCYYGSWAVYRPGLGKFSVDNIDPTLCTHLIYSFVGITEIGGIKVLDAWNDLPDNYGKNAIGVFTDLCKKSPNTKCLIAIGGWNEGSARYSTVAANPALREKFAENAVTFLKKYKFDGLDMDWEYPAQRGGKPEDKRNFSLWMKVIKDRFRPEGLLLTAAVASAEPSASQSYEIDKICQSFDFINVMAYDLHGSWEKQTGHNAPLYSRTGESGNDLKLNVNASMNYWLRQGCPPEKLILGVPFYGRTFTLADKNQNGLGAPTTGPGTAGPYTRENGMFGFNEICVIFKEGGWTIVHNKEHRTPYAYKGNQWMGYDDITSLTEKCKYINDMGFGGAMLWSIETDDFQGSCGEKYPLLKTLNAGMRGGVPVPPPVIPEQPERPSEQTTQQPPTQQPPTQQPPTTQPPIRNGVCKKGGYVGDEQDCNVFYYCNGNTLEATRFYCPRELVWNPKITNCDRPKNVPGC